MTIAGTIVAGPDARVRREALAQFPKAFIPVPGPDGGTVGSLAVMSAGNPDGRRVVFVHGSPGDAADWSHFLLTVPDDRHSIAVDRPGFGETRPDSAMISLAAQAEILRPALGPTGSPGCVLVGYSLGAPVAARLTIDAPDRVAALVLLGGALDPELERDFALQRMADRPSMRKLLPRAIANSNTELRGLRHELAVMTADLERITVPVVIVHGNQDPLVPYDNVAFMQRRLTGCRALTICTLDGADHFLPWKNLDAVEQAITDAVTAADQAQA